MQRVSSYIQRLLLFKPTYLWCMNRWETQSFGTLGTHFAYTLPSIIQKRNSDSNPLRLPGERLRDKGRRSTITMIFSTVSSMHIDQSISTVLQSRRFAKYTHSTEGQQRPLHPCEQQRGIFFSQKLTDNGEMVSITSFTYHLSNSLSESDIIASTWNYYSMTKFLSIKPPVGVLSPLCLPRAVEPFLGWMPEHLRFYLICLPGGFGGWSSEVQLGESISAIVPSLFLLFEILLNQLNQYLFLLLILFFKTFRRNVGYSSQCETT
jgi:hypothetical protein